jgi:protein-L-isoaspartate(D-aspartate) O-methyltransferase
MRVARQRPGPGDLVAAPGLTGRDLTAQAKRNLAGGGIENVVITGDGTRGVPWHAPFDAIIVSAAFPAVPPPRIAVITGHRSRPRSVSRYSDRGGWSE